MKRAFTAIVCLILAGSALPAQTVLKGTVRADGSGLPLAGIEVILVGSDRHTVSDTLGRYSLVGAPRGRRMLLFRAVGYRPVQEWVLLGTEDTVWANATMLAAAKQLSPITVTERPAAPRGMGVEAFEERRRMGFGKFIDSAELRRSEHLGLVDLLRRLPGIEFVGAGRHWYAASARKHGPDGTKCLMDVILDGVPINSPPDLSWFEPWSLQAVEVYRSAAEVPIEFGGASAACGVLVLWTKRGG